MMMRVLFLFFALTNMLMANAQKSINNIIANMPDEIVPYLNAEQRAELGHFAESTDTTTIKNMLNGTTCIDSINSTFARIKLNKVSDLQIKILPLKDTTQIICVIKTIRKPVADSNIKFYTMEWERIKNTFGLPLSDSTPTNILDNLTTCPDSMSTDRYVELRNMLEFVTASAMFTSEGNEITFSLSLPLLNNQEREDIKPIVKQKSFKWDGENFNYF